MSKTKEIQPLKWEIKDRRYYLLHEKEPLTYTLNSRNTSRHPLLWFDEKTGEQKELRYATNQNSPFVSEQKGEVTLGHIVFEDGVLAVPKEKQNLQKLLSLYHPKKNTIYTEWEAEVVAEDELEDINVELDAMLAAKEMDIDHAEAVLRVEIGSKVSSLSSKELRRDLLLMARKNPTAFLAIASDENVGLRNVGIRAEEQGIIKLAQDQRTFHWGSNDRKLMTIVFKTIQKKLQ
jgi:hypothetical protein